MCGVHDFHTLRPRPAAPDTRTFQEARMTSAPAPSSRRLKPNDVQIDVVAKSRAMQALMANVHSRLNGGKYICLTVRPGDTPELQNFVEIAASSLGLPMPRVVTPAEGSLCRRPAEAKREDELDPRGVLAIRMDEYSKPMLDELVRLERRGYRFPWLMATFTSPQSQKAAAAEWPNAVWNLFDPEPARWPSLRDRQTDLRDIISSVAERVVSEDGRWQAELTEDAMTAICHKRLRHVSDIMAHVQGAFDVMLRSPTGSAITAEHVQIACDPVRRRQLLERTASASPD